MSLLVVGSVALDTVEAPAGRVEEALGGSAVYFSVAASYFTDVCVVGAVGTDFPSRYVDDLRKRGIDVAGLERRDGPTFRWSGRYEEDLNTRTTLSVNPGVFEGWRPQIPEGFRSASHVFLANCNPNLQLHVLDQVERPEFVAADTMNLWIKTEREAVERLIRRADCFILNDEESRMLLGAMPLHHAARRLLDMGPSVVIIKKGVHGCVMAHGSDLFLLPAWPLEKEVDPTGAGDCFAGAFCGFVAREGVSPGALRRALAYATVTASFCVEDFSIRGYEGLTRSDLDERVEAFCRITHVEGRGR